MALHCRCTPGSGQTLPVLRTMQPATALAERFSDKPCNKQTQMIKVDFREGTLRDDKATAEHSLEMWLAMGCPADELQPDALDRTLRFMSEARKDLEYKAFVAEAQGLLVGSACCQLLAGQMPLVFKAGRKYGHIWGVYVQPEYRKQGIARQLIQMCIDHLKEVQCTQITLHASPQGRSMYQQLGFVEGREMRLDLAPFIP